MQLSEHNGGVRAGHLEGDIAKGRGLGVQLQQSPQTVVAIHHPELTGGTAHQRRRFAL